MPENDAYPDDFSSDDPPSAWVTLLRSTIDACSWQVRYRTGGRKAGFRDLGKRTPYGEPGTEVLGKGGESLTLDDPGARAACEAWEKAAAHWDAIKDRGGRYCGYGLAVFDADGNDLDLQTKTFHARVTTGEAKEEESSDRGDHWDTLSRRQMDFVKHMTETTKKKDDSIVSLLGKVVDLIGRIPTAPPEAPNRDAEWMAGAATGVARAKEMGSSLRKFIEQAGRIVGEEFRANRSENMTAPIVLELVGASQDDQELIEAVLAGDLETARRFTDVPQECKLFWEWVSVPS